VDYWWTGGLVDAEPAIARAAAAAKPFATGSAAPDRALRRGRHRLVGRGHTAGPPWLPLRAAMARGAHAAMARGAAARRPPPAAPARAQRR
jgi:hypothetical protein